VKPYYQDKWVTIYLGDCREILPQLDVRDCFPHLTENKVDLVLTDPPYAEDAIELYEIAARESKNILKQGGFFYAYCGTIFLPELLSCISRHLDWFWLHNLRLNGGYPSIWKVHIQQNSKPILCYTNGKPNLKDIKWSFTDFTKDKPDKKYHKAWGQGSTVPLEIIMLRTFENEIVLDPYCGGGNNIMAAKILQRHGVGIEISEKYCEIAAKRCSQEVMELGL